MGDWDLMDTMLIILGTVGVTAILLSAYIFTVAARTYVSEQEAEPVEGLRVGAMERRNGYAANFARTNRGRGVEAERRRCRERRGGFFS
jgi:hypothetical protein